MIKEDFLCNLNIYKSPSPSWLHDVCKELVSDVDIVAVLLALGDPVTEVTSTDTIINATLTQDDPPCVPVIIITSVSSRTSFTSGYLTFSSSHKMNEEGWDSLSQADTARMPVIFLLILNQNLLLTMKN